ncbi:MAG: hypothetical protein U0271_38780 [Polyangiaceae bacterium]
MTAAAHVWSFFRAGGVDQVVLQSGEDIRQLKGLDQKLWVALACPTKSSHIDERTLTLLDTDADGRVRPPEVLAAVEWCGKAFRSLDLLLEEGDSVPLEAFHDKTDEGKALRASAARILGDLQKAKAQSISVSDLSRVEKAFSATRFNGDGVVPPESAEDPKHKAAIEDVLACVGSTPDRSGLAGVDKPRVQTFFDRARKLVAWSDEGLSVEISPLGDKTAAAALAVVAVEDKVNDWFTRCRLLAFDARGSEALTAATSNMTALAGLELAPSHPEIKKLPLAKVESSAKLPLLDGLNPGWAVAVRRLASDAVEPLLGTSVKTLSEADWSTLTAKVAPYRNWLAKKPEANLGSLSLERLRELLASGAEAAILALIDKDLELAKEYSEIGNVERAVLYRRDFGRVLRNFVNFSDFYAGRGGAFQAGTLLLDARGCDLCIYVDDPAKHAALAGLSSCYLAYCDIERRGPELEKKQIVAAFTAGDTDHLMVGRNGVFYDRLGRDWDARIVNIIENPISVRQAFWSPYKRLVRLVEEQVAKRAAEKEKASSQTIEATAEKTANADKAAATPPPAAPEKKVDIGTVAAVSVAVAGFATFLSATLATFLGLGMWMPLGVFAVLMGISGPSMLIAWLKLRRRNLGPVLDANGWAINGRARINVPFGTSLTALSRLPEGAQRKLNDPYAEKPTPWRRWVVLGVVVLVAGAWFLGKLDTYLPDRVKAARVLHRTS